MSRRPDKDMEQPKAYKSSIDSKKTQPSMNMNTRHKDYNPSKAIDFKTKIPEYKPNNEYYKTSFWDAPRRKIVQQKREPPKPQPPPPQPRQQAPRRPPPKPQDNSLKPLPQPNFNTKPRAQPMKQQTPPNPQPQPEPQKPPPPKPVIQPEPEIAAPAEEVKMEHWSEPTRSFPVLAPVPAPAKRESDLALLPSTVGSMSRMIAMFN